MTTATPTPSRRPLGPAGWLVVVALVVAIVLLSPDRAPGPAASPTPMPTVEPMARVCLRIVDSGDEGVTVANACAEAVPLEGWSLRRSSAEAPLGSEGLAPGATLTVAPSGPADDPVELLAPDGSVAFEWSPDRDRTLVGAGDIAICGRETDEATARLLDDIPGTVVTLGDNAYDNGSMRDYAECYGPGWGRHRERTRPALGNHDHRTAGGAPTFEYFGSNAGPPGRGFYSYERGAWHVVVLDSECDAVGGCQAGSFQERWLRADLDAHPAACTLAYWHRPRFSSAQRHGSDPAMGDLWAALAEAGAEVVMAGHDHAYERFGPLDADGREDPGRGITSFVVGTGGAEPYGFGTPVEGSEVRHSGAYGVLRLDLAQAGLRWTFVPTEPGSFTDRGELACR